MNKRQFALSAAAFVVALALVSCEPLRGHAVEIGYEERAGIYDYMAAGGENLGLIDFRLDDDSDGNRSVRVKIYALQSAMLAAQSQIYDNMDFSLAPDSVTVSGSSLTGLYKSELDGKNHAITQTLGDSNFTSAVAWSDELSLAYSVTNYRTGTMTSSFTSGSSERVYHNGHYYVTSAPYTITFPDTSYFTNPYTNTYTWGTDRTSSVSLIITTSTASIPTLSRAQNWSNVVGATTGLIIGSNGVSVDLPPASVDTKSPWDYYNNTLLPYIQDEFPNFPDLPDYLIFPDGYDEPEQPTTVPVEYPTLPGFDFALETNGTEPASDYNYNIPDLPGKDVAVPQFDFTQINPAEVMAPVAEGLKGIWQLIAMVLTEYGLFPYVGLAVFAAIVLMLLRLGK